MGNAGVGLKEEAFVSARKIAMLVILMAAGRKDRRGKLKMKYRSYLAVCARVIGN